MQGSFNGFAIPQPVKTNPKVILEKLDPMKLPKRSNDDLRNHLNNRKITATISLNPNAPKAFKLTTLASDELSEEALLKDADNMSVLSTGIDEDTLLEDDDDDEENFLPVEDNELDYEDDTLHDNSINEPDFDTMSIAPDQNEFRDEFKDLGSSSIRNNSKSKGKSAININNKRRLDENPVTTHDMILNWQNKNTKDNQTNFKIPKVVHNVKKSPEKPKKETHSPEYQRKYNTYQHDRRNRNTKRDDNNGFMSNNNVIGVMRPPLFQTNCPPLFQNGPRVMVPNQNGIVLNKDYQNQNGNLSNPRGQLNMPGIARMPLHPMLNVQIRPAHIFQHDPLLLFPNTNSQEQPDLRANLNNLSNRDLGCQPQYHAGNVVQDIQQNHHFDKKATNWGQKSIPKDNNFRNNHHNGNTGKKKHYPGLCRRFQIGLCNRGMNCKFEHKKVETESNSSDDQVNGQDNYGEYQKSLRRGVSISSPIQGLFEKLKHVIDVKDYSAIPNLVQSIEEKIKADQNKGKVNNEDIYQLSKSIEDGILMIFGDGNRANMHRGATLSMQLITTKQNLKCESVEDMLYVSKIHFKIQEFRRCFSIMAKMNISKLEKKEIRDEVESHFKDCIGQDGLFFDHWNEFKKFVLYNTNIMDKIFILTNFQLLVDKMTTEDLNICHNEIFKGRLKLSPKCKEVFLRLYTPTASVNLIIDLLKSWSDLSVVPTMTVEKILKNIDLTDIFTALNVLKRIPGHVLKKSSQLWNEFLAICCKKDNIQVSEQVFGVMQQASISCEFNSSLNMLAAMIKSKHFTGFLTRFDEVNHLFSGDFIYPNWFADVVCDNLEFVENDLNVIFRMITILILSSQPPIESKIHELLTALRQKRRFQDTFEFVSQCFDRSVILSQIELRKVVLFLEEWTKNVNASISIYKRMREAYPRPEQLVDYWALVESGVHKNPSRHSSSGNGELESPTLRIPQYNRQDSIGIAIPSAVETQEQKLLKLSAELSACSTSIETLFTTYLKAVSMGLANDDAIVFGLFLALSDNTASAADYDLFVTNLIEKYEELSADISNAVARLGIRLIQQHHVNSLDADAYEILKVLHSKSVSYDNSGEPFGTLGSTKTLMSQCAIRNLCCLVCNTQEIYESAYIVFSCCSNDDDGDDDADDDVDPIELLERNDILYTTMLGLIRGDEIVKADEIFVKCQSSLPIPMKTTISNELCLNYCKNDEISVARKFYKYIDTNKLDFNIETITAYITLLSKSNLRHEAYCAFLKGLQEKLYTETYRAESPLIVEIPTCLGIPVVRFLIERHLNKLRHHPQYGADALEIPANTDNELQVIVIPQNETLDSCYDAVKKTIEDICLVVVTVFNPPLEIVRKLQHLQKICISLTSLLRWFPHNVRLGYTSETPPPNTANGAVPINRRTIEVGDANPMTVTICPTPQHESMQNYNVVQHVNNKAILNAVQNTYNKDILNLNDIKEESKEIFHNFSQSGGIRQSNPGGMHVTQSRGMHLQAQQKKKGTLEFVDTNDPILATKFIRKTIVMCLTRYWKNKYISDEEFPSFSKDIFDRYIAQLEEERGCIFYNEDIGVDAHRFAESHGERRFVDIDD